MAFYVRSDALTLGSCKERDCYSGALGILDVLLMGSCMKQNTRYESLCGRCLYVRRVAFESVAHANSNQVKAFGTPEKGMS